MDDQPHTLGELVALRARNTPGAPALLAPGRTAMTYGALQERVQRIVGLLAGCGARRGERIAVALPNGPDMAVAVLGAATVATCAPLNPGYGEAQWRFYLRDLQPKALLLAAGQCAGAREIARELRIQCLDVHWGEGSPAGAFDIAGLSPFPSTGEDRPIEDDVAIVLHTSGTTSRPKLVPLTHRNILRSARNVAQSLSLTSTDRCLNLMPLFHVHGLVAALCGSIWAGGGVACTPGMREESFLAWLAALEPTWYTAVPTIHEAVLRTLAGNGTPAHKLRFARSSSSVLPRRLAAELESALGVPVIDAYGMTEAAHQIAANPLPPLPRKSGTVGRPAGPEIGIMDPEGKLLSRGVGEIVIRGENVMSGYHGDGEANRAAFVDGWFRTGDAGFIDEDGFLTLTGRLKELINRGGEKISPAEVEQALYEHDAVQQAVAFAVPHATLGEDIAAAVVLRPNASPTPEALRRFLVGRVAEGRIPSTIVFVEALPKGPTGKLQRIGLAERLSGRLAAPFVPPRTPTEVAVAETFGAVLGVERVGAHDNFFALGGDSLRGNQVLARLRPRADMTLMALFTHPTVAGLAHKIEESASALPGDTSTDRLLEIARQRRTDGMS